MSDEPKEPPKRDPNDISTWGLGCGTGVPYKNTGVSQSGAKNQRRTLGGGRKHRGSASGDLEKREKGGDS